MARVAWLRLYNDADEVIISNPQFQQESVFHSIPAGVSCRITEFQGDEREG